MAIEGFRERQVGRSLKHPIELAAVENFTRSSVGVRTTQDREDTGAMFLGEFGHEVGGVSFAVQRGHSDDIRPQLSQTGDEPVRGHGLPGPRRGLLLPPCPAREVRRCPLHDCCGD